MKKAILILASLLFLLTSCKKENKNSEPSNHNTSDSITLVYYKNFEPDTTIVLFADSSSFIDLNNDSTNDARFTLAHWLEYFGPHAIDCYRLFLTGNDSTEFLINNQGCFSCEGPYDTSMYINTNDSAQKYFTLLLTTSQLGCNCFMSKNYIGFILHNKGKKYLGWIHVQTLNTNTLLIDDYATMISSNDSIQIGYHQ